MSADSIIYCLEHLSDYREFERLCSALLRGAGYRGLDPLGGTGDEGRDAVIRADELGRKISFAYSVRSDWRKKLQQDTKRVREAGHAPDMFVFASTQALDAAEKDWAHTFVKDTYGWSFDLWDLERLRVEIVGAQSHLITQHPAIFTPRFFRQRGGESIAESRDLLLIDHVVADHALATWLARRLSLAGFRTWCLGTAPLAGEDADESVRQLLGARAIQYLPVVSLASTADTSFLERCTLAVARPDFVLPCSLIVFPSPRLPSRLAKVTPVDFDVSWKMGLTQLLAQLSSRGITPSNDHDRSRQIALRDYLARPVTIAKAEPVFANAFPLRLPRSMLIYDLTRPLSDAEILALRPRWAFVAFHPTQLAAFVPPPPNAIPDEPVQPRKDTSRHRRRTTVDDPAIATPEFSWMDIEVRGGKRSRDVAKELAWRSLQVASANKGLEYCGDRKLFYFPRKDGQDWTQRLRHVDGRVTSVQLSGDRTKGWGDRASPFLYQLAPRFRPQLEDDGTSTMLVNLYVRVTDPNGVPYVDKEIGRRRKVVGKSWWNKEWLARMLGVVQALETREGVIQVGDEPRAVVMQTRPLSWMSPVGLDTTALAGLADIGAEMAEARADENQADDDGESSIEAEAT